MSSNNRKRKKAQATVAVHAKEHSNDPFGTAVPPVYHSSIFSFKSFADLRRYAKGELDGYFYSRYANPTVANVERQIAELEGADAAVVVSSGSAATFCALAALCQAGDEVVACNAIYGGTIRIMTELLGRFEIKTKFIRVDQIQELSKISSDPTKVFWFETPTNPINRIIDLREAADVARQAGIFSIVDNTFATPVLQQPLALGVDAVVHSATKYLGGHSDLTAGAVVGSAEFIGKARRISVLIGATLDPAAAYLLSRGIKTLEIRVKAACQNALRLAETLAAHEKVARVYYPGLETDADHKLARSQMKAFGGVVAMDLVGGEPEVERFFDSLGFIRSAPSLGGVETLVSYPLYSSHAGFSDEQMRAAGVSTSTVRFSVGIEDADDIIEDVVQALERV